MFSLTQCFLKHSFISLFSFFSRTKPKSTTVKVSSRKLSSKELLEFTFLSEKLLCHIFKNLSTKMSKMTEISRDFLSKFHCGYSFCAWPNLRDLNMCFMYLYWINILTWIENICTWEWELKEERKKKEKKFPKLLFQTSSKVENYFLRKAMKCVCMLLYCVKAKGSNKYKSNRSPWKYVLFFIVFQKLIALPAIYDKVGNYKCI